MDGAKAVVTEIPQPRGDSTAVGLTGLNAVFEHKSLVDRPEWVPSYFLCLIFILIGKENKLKTQFMLQNRIVFSPCKLPG